MPKVRDMSTPDKVLLFVTALVGFLAVTLVIGMFLAAFFAPEDTDLTGIVDLISNAFLMLVGAIVGYIGGQGLNKLDEDRKTIEELKRDQGASSE